MAYLEAIHQPSVKEKKGDFEFLLTSHTYVLYVNEQYHPQPRPPYDQRLPRPQQQPRHAVHSLSPSLSHTHLLQYLYRQTRCTGFNLPRCVKEGKSKAASKSLLGLDSSAVLFFWPFSISVQVSHCLHRDRTGKKSR